MTRADAVRNRARVVAAAATVFARHGLDAGVDAVAEAAGVGKATVYRSFPTKEHLFAAVAVQRIRWFQERAEAAALRDDALGALQELLESIAEVQARDRVIGGSLTARLSGPVPELAEAREAAGVALERVVARARDEGALRGDVTAEDVGVLFGGLCRELGERGEQDPEVWRRYARMVLAALRS